MEKEVQPRGTISIRYATTADVPLLIELGVQTFYDTFAEVNKKSDMDEYLEKNFNESQVLSELNDHSNTFLIAEADPGPAGCAKLRKGTTPGELKGQRAIELERLYAAKSHIGKGVGMSLMNRCIELAGKEGFTVLWLGVWEHNHRAIAFYKKCG